MKPTLLSLFLILFTAGVVGCSSAQKRSEEEGLSHLQMGSSLLENGAFPQALSELLKAEALMPQNPLVQNQLGLVYFARSRLDLSEKHLRRAVVLNPRYTEAKNNLGRVLTDRQDWTNAFLFLSEAARDLTYPQPEKPLANLGYLHFQKKEFAQARKYLAQSIDANRKNCFAQTLYGRTLLELKEYSSAADSLDRAVGVCGSLSAEEPQYYGALAYFHSGDSSKAELRLEEILKLNADGSFRERARALLETIRR